MIDAEFLSVLCCPFCATRPLTGKSVLAQGELEAVAWSARDARPGVSEGLRCRDCGRTYPISGEGFPDLLIASALLPENPPPAAARS